MQIEVHDITKRFGKSTALDHVSITFSGSKIYGLLGNNGAGKSTLLNLMTDRLRPTEGTITVDGQPVLDNDAALSKLFCVNDQNLFPDDMKVRRAFEVAKLFHPEFDRNFADSLAQKFELNEKKKVNALSTGYSSIFRLIIGLSINTPCVIFDEPVLGLDARHRDFFYQILIQKYADHPCMLIISTHLIEEIFNLIEHSVILYHGKVLKNCPTEELMAAAYSVSGPIQLMDSYLSGKHVLTQKVLGGLKTACVQGKPDDNLPAGLERSKVNLQDYFINLMEEEESK